MRLKRSMSQTENDSGCPCRCQRWNSSEKLARNVVEPRLHFRFQVGEIRRGHGFLTQVDHLGLHRELETGRVVGAPLRGAGLPSRPILELRELPRDLLKERFELALRFESARDFADGVGDTAQERLPAALGDAELEPPRQRRGRLGERRHLREPAYERAQQARDLVRDGARSGDYDHAAGDGAGRRALQLDGTLGLQGPHEARHARVEIQRRRIGAAPP